MNLLLWGLTIGTIGKLILGLAVLRVHLGIMREHSIDDAVIKSIKRERYVTFLGLILIAAGYVLEVMFYGIATPFFDCAGTECAAMLDAAFGE